MAKTIKISGIIMLSVILAVSCNKRQDTPAEEHKRLTDVKLWILPQKQVSKSTFEGSASQINSLQVWAYSDGILEASVQCSPQDAAIKLYEGRNYHIYALANCNKITPPDKETNLDTLRIRIKTYGDLNRTGIPMSNVVPECFTAYNGGGVCIILTRMVAQYSISVARHCDIYGGIQKSDMEINTISIRNAPASVTPFRTGSRADRTIDGDVASLHDLKAVENGGKAVFYILENMNGSIPSITSERAKDWNSIEGAGLDPDLYTYIELKGRFTYSDRPDKSSDYELDQDMCIRCWMGENSTDDFNIERNISYDSRIVYSDFGWTLENGRADVENVNEDASYLIYFCDDRGLSLNRVNFNLEEHIKLYFKALNCKTQDLTINCSSSYASLHLETDGGIKDLGGGLFRQDFINRHTERQMLQSAVFTVSDSAHSISSDISCSFSGSSSGIGQWFPETDLDIYF